LHGRDRRYLACLACLGGVRVLTVSYAAIAAAEPVIASGVLFLETFLQSLFKGGIPLCSVFRELVLIQLFAKIGLCKIF
jgi:hypothetical protein